MQILKQAKPRAADTTPQLRRDVADIIEGVRQNGDEALLRYNEKFDGSHRGALRVAAGEIQDAYRQVPPQQLEDMRQAAANVRRFALAQKETVQELEGFTLFPGAVLGHRVLPVESCLCYVPGGGYPLYSSALMLAVPAKVAGVGRVAACSPVVKGSDAIHPKTLVAMDIAGVDEIYAVGGAHAIAAFAYGTGQIRPVDLIVGPGNSYVTEAKRQCYGQVGLDFIAGPSEVLVIADDSADATVLALDLLAQSEHDPMAQGILVTTSEALGCGVMEEVEKQLATLPTAGIAVKAWADFGEVILADDLEEAARIANHRAPEHLEVQTREDEQLAAKLHNYGSLFVGQYTAEVFGDYASGSNHTLPTLRAARYTGGVWVGTFQKTCTHQTLNRQAMMQLAPLTRRLAEGEGLAAHAKAAEIRMEKYSR